MKKIVIFSLFMVLAITSIISLNAGWFGKSSGDGGNAVKVGFVNMNEAGLDEISATAFEYGKQLVGERRDEINSLKEELKRVQEEARNTPEALELREKIKPLLEAWEKIEKLKKEEGGKEKMEEAGNEFYALMSDDELSAAYKEFHSLTGSDGNAANINKKLMAINGEIDALVEKKEEELKKEFSSIVKRISSDMGRHGFNVIIGVTEYSVDKKNIFKEFEILHAEKEGVEDITNKIKTRLKFGSY